MERVTKAKVLKPQDGKAGWLMTCGVRFMAWTEETGGGFSLVEHPIPPRTLAAPLHIHEREDEYSYVVEGRVGVYADGEVVYGEPGDLLFKPRGQWHTFWNAGDVELRFIELLLPGGFEGYFAYLAARLASADDADPDGVRATVARYGLEVEASSVPGLCERFGLTFGRS